MNKSQLVDALAERIGDRRTAAAAVDGLLDTIVETVRSGEAVSLTGFGVFEGRARAARTTRNPRTGEPVAVPATTVPVFRPGAGFRAAVRGNGPASADGASAPAPTAAAEVDAPADEGVNGKGRAKRAGKKADKKDADKKDKAKAGKGKKAKAKNNKK